MPGIKDKVVIITGASSGIGEAFKCGLWNSECGTKAQLEGARGDRPRYRVRDRAAVRCGCERDYCAPHCADLISALNCFEKFAHPKTYSLHEANSSHAPSERAARRRG